MSSQPNPNPALKLAVMPNKHWLAFPTVRVPSPTAPNVNWVCEISPIFVERNAHIGRKTPIFQMWTHVIGQLPGINLIGTIRPKPTVLTVQDARACFQGVNRPYDDEEDGASILVYVLAPKISIAYHPSLACVARAVTVPSDTVLTVQIRPTSSLQKSQQGIDGTITRLEFVSTVGSDPALPVGHDTRYRKLHWKR